MQSGVRPQGASCEASDDHYWDDCPHLSANIDAAQDACRTQLVQAYGCGADHSWFCVPKEGGGRTLTQFDTPRGLGRRLRLREANSPDAGTP